MVQNTFIENMRTRARKNPDDPMVTEFQKKYPIEFMTMKEFIMAGKKGIKNDWMKVIEFIDLINSGIINEYEFNRGKHGCSKQQIRDITSEYQIDFGNVVNIALREGVPTVSDGNTRTESMLRIYRDKDTPERHRRKILNSRINVQFSATADFHKHHTTNKNQNSHSLGTTLSNIDSYYGHWIYQILEKGLKSYCNLKDVPSFNTCKKTTTPYFKLLAGIIETLKSHREGANLSYTFYYTRALRDVESKRFDSIYKKLLTKTTINDIAEEFVFAKQLMAKLEDTYVPHYDDEGKSYFKLHNGLVIAGIIVFNRLHEKYASRKITFSDVAVVVDAINNDETYKTVAPLVAVCNGKQIEKTKTIEQAILAVIRKSMNKQ